jgi:two-component system sensor histidine kinase PilS (NtrC family)
MKDFYEDRFPNQDALDALTWKPLRLLSFYRVILAGLLVVLFFTLSDSTTLGFQNPAVYKLTAIGYLLFGVLAGFAARLRKPGYELQTVVQILVDIIAITVLMFASGGPASGLGMLLIISVATGSILLPGRMAFLFAAIATIAIIGEQTYSMVILGATRPAGYTQAGLLGLALFATAGIAYLLVLRIKETEALALRRGIDIDNLAKLNAMIVKRLQAGIIVTDHLHRIRLINDTALKLLNKPAAKPNQSLQTFSTDLYKKLEAWRNTPESEPSLLDVEATGTKLLTHFTLLGTSEGLGSLIFLEDTATMSKRAQQIKLASLGRLTASIAHEIRNPLGAIGHATQLLDESEALDDSDRRLITIIGNHTRRVNTVVENVLQLSRPGTSLPQQIHLRDWLKSFVNEFGHSGNCQPQQIRFSVEPQDLEVHCDPSLLHQVVWNLCQNAARHGSGKETALQIRLVGACLPSSERPCLDIIDNGPGIEPELAEKIFEPFFTTKSSGTGLGLYIAREICESNQSQLDYFPATEGGSCFRITFTGKEALPVATFV